MGTVTMAPGTKRKPAIDSLGTNLPIRDKSPAKRMIAMMDIIRPPENTGWGALPVAEMIDSTGQGKHNDYFRNFL